MMIPDLEQLEEVVVIGYGSVLKKDLTGSLSQVEVDEEVANQSKSQSINEQVKKRLPFGSRDGKSTEGITMALVERNNENPWNT